MDLKQFIDEKQQRNAEYGEKKQAERAELMDMLEGSVMDITSIPENYRAFLDLQAATGSRYSAGNAALVMAQKPDATQLGSVGYWNGEGRKVNRGETSIRIMVPESYDYVKREQQQDPDTGEVSTTNERKRGRGYKVGGVFDVSQTSGKPMKEPLRMGSEESLAKGLKALVDIAPVPLRVDENLSVPALYDSVTMDISINDQYPSNHIFAALSIEVAHAQLHGAGRYTGYTREGCEFYAQSVAHVVCKRYGVESHAGDFAKTGVEFSDLGYEGRREVLDMLHDISKGMGDRVSAELGVPVHQRQSKSRSGNAR